MATKLIAQTNTRSISQFNGTLFQTLLSLNDLSFVRLDTFKTRTDLDINTIRALLSL